VIKKRVNLLTWKESRAEKWGEWSRTPAFIAKKGEKRLDLVLKERSEKSLREIETRKNNRYKIWGGGRKRDTWRKRGSKTVRINRDSLKSCVEVQRTENHGNGPRQSQQILYDKREVSKCTRT